MGHFYFATALFALVKPLSVVYYRFSRTEEILVMPPGKSQGSLKQKEGLVELYVVAAELAFLLVPFIVICFAHLYKADLNTVLYSPYWSIASSTLIGQALIRFISRLLQSRADDSAISWEKVTLLFSVLVVLGLIPSLVVLLLVLISTQPSSYLGIAQVILFVFGVSLYLAFGWMGQEMISHSRTAEESTVERDIAPANAPRSYQRASGE